MIRPMNPVVLIPARLASTRLPDKPLADIAGRPMIVHVWQRAKEAGIGPVYVAAAEPEIAEAVSRMLEGATPMSNALQGFLGTLVTGILASAVIAIRVRAHPARTAV